MKKFIEDVERNKGIGDDVYYAAANYPQKDVGDDLREDEVLVLYLKSGGVQVRAERNLINGTGYYPPKKDVTLAEVDGFDVVRIASVDAGSFGKTIQDSKEGS